ncbi:MAG: hypothetical protein AAFR84_10435, partial [Pseudomonadota bacterium]
QPLEAVQTPLLRHVARLRKQDRERLNRIIEVEIPKLRSELYEKLDQQAAQPVPAPEPAAAAADAVSGD